MSFFFFTVTATTEIYTLSLHDALPIFGRPDRRRGPIERHRGRRRGGDPARGDHAAAGDRKSTRLNSSHMSISYAVFCLKKKKKMENGGVPTSRYRTACAHANPEILRSK